MNENINNKEYWDDYVDYWIVRVNENNNGQAVDDKMPEDTLMEKYFDLLNLQPNEQLLDFGCGFGRLFPLYMKRMGTVEGYTGIDVSQRSLNTASQLHNELEVGKNLIEFDGLNIPFKNNEFDKIFCMSVFDVTIQHKILEEMLRVLKVNGELFLTGKNNDYCDDDEMAIVAEVNARKKNFPNNFTDVRKLKSELENRGYVLIKEMYYIYREDWAKDQYQTIMPEQFYQWAIIIKKKNESIDLSFDVFSDIESKTIKRICKKDFQTTL